MGLYFGKVRARNSSIRGFEGAAGGVVRWIRLANDTAIAVDQLGVRQGAVAVYLDAWHKDLPEFLQLRTNNGDERMKAHDVFPAVCYPDLFWKIAREDLDADWYLMCPHDICLAKGYCLEDYWGEEWEKRYRDCVSDPAIAKRVVPIREIVRLVIKSAVETGTPFVFNRDAVNRMNPNGDKGIVYCSNLCTEIAQNMSAISEVEQRVETVDGETVVVTVTRPGDFVVCNLASLSLGVIDVDDDAEIEQLTRSAVRALDNVIDLNFFPVPYAKINNLRYRPIGLGVSGYPHMLAKRGIAWESEEHLAFADRVFEKINYYAVSASCENAAEKGAYALFGGSDWQTGAYFDKRGYHSPVWQALRARVAKTGMRNGWLLAVAPTSSTSIIAATTAGVDPLMNRFFLEEKKNGLVPRVAPELTEATYWYYKSAHHIDQTWSVRAAGVRQRHIDQSQSVNLYITTDYSFRQVLNLYVLAFEQGVKTIYYIRSKSLEVSECEACSS
jgi:ribonucleoside-diphosphate reductase alpha chain